MNTNYYKVLPPEIGKGEGGGKIAELQAMINALAVDVKAAYIAGSLNDADRKFRGNDETIYSYGGTVSDPLAAGIEGVLVTAYLKDSQTNIADAVLTDSNGDYALSLYAGTYDIVMTKTGYTSVSYDDTTVSADSTAFDKTMATNLVVLSTSPVASSTAQPGTIIDIVFDRALTDNSGDDDIKDDLEVTVDETPATITSGTIVTTTISNDTLRITMASSLGEDKAIAVTVGASATVKGANSELLVEDYEFAFDTGFTYLTVDTLTPLDEATDVATLNEITVLCGVNIIDASGAGAIKDGITVTVGGSPVTISDATVDTATLTITLAAYIACQNQEVVVTIDKDNTISTATGGIFENDVEFSFTMNDYLAVSSVVPVAGSGTSNTDTIAITFDQNIADNSGAGEIVDSIVVTNGGVPETFTDDATNIDITDAVLTITLGANLGENGQTVTVTIPSAATVKGSTKGCLLEEDYVYSFSMVAA